MPPFFESNETVRKHVRKRLRHADKHARFKFHQMNLARRDSRNPMEGPFAAIERFAESSFTCTTKGLCRVVGPTNGGDLLRAITRCALLSVAAIATVVWFSRSRQAPRASSCPFALLLLSGTALLGPRAQLVLQDAVRREPPRLALCYWGLTRSTRFVHISHEQHIFGALRAANVSYRTFMHTWALEKGETDALQGVVTRMHLDTEEWKLLQPHAFRSERQSHFVHHSINESALRAWARSIPEGGNPFRLPTALRNHLCSLEGLRRVHHLAVSSGFAFTHAVFLRPDAWISTDLPLHALPPPGKVVLPSTGNTGGWNDQFAVLHAHTAPVYARRIALAPAYWSRGKLLTYTAHARPERLLVARACIALTTHALTALPRCCHIVGGYGGHVGRLLPLCSGGGWRVALV